MKHCKGIDFFDEIRYLRIRKPFLKWAGSKTKIIREIKKILPKGERLVEPFTGSASLFINTNFSDYLLSDSNGDLINLFLMLKNYKHGFIESCKKYFVKENNKEDKYNILRKKFNAETDMFIRCSIFVYLNRHCFNGLCRYNSLGDFNVPFGKYDDPHFPEKEMREFIDNCNSKKVQFKRKDFRGTFEMINKGDVVYCDPPYYPISKTSSFTAYDGESFTDTDQKNLAQLAEECNVPVIISNSDIPETRELYKNASIIKEIKVRRFVGGKREEVGEIMALFKK